MMPMRCFLCLVICGILSTIPVAAATVTAASCAPTDVQAAITAANIGDTVHLPTCTYTNWNTTVTIDKRIILEGNGTANTIIHRARVPASYESNEMFVVNMVTGFEMRNLTLDGTADTDPNVWQDFAIALFHCVDFRLHHLTIRNFAIGIQVSGAEDIQRGVIDHNTFANNYYTTAGGSLGYSVSLVGRGNWTATELGTAQNVFVEDNTFTGCRHCIAANYSSRYVFRYNQIVDNGPDAASIDVHGRNTDNFPRGTHQWEIYSNVLTNTDNRSWYAGIGVEGGTGVIFDNQIAPGMDVFDIYFSDYCSGATYPIQDQVQDSYLWNNTLTGSATAATVSVDPACSSIIQAGRDYFLTPRPGYTPYRYPHPVTQGCPVSPASIPTNLEVLPSTGRLRRR